MSKIIDVTFQMPNDQRISQKVDTSITVDRMITNFFEHMRMIHEIEDYSLMVNSTPINKEKTRKKLVKHCHAIVPNCLIKVKKTRNVKGASKI